MPKREVHAPLSGHLRQTVNVTERLGTVAPDLVPVLTSLPGDEKRRIALALAQEAVDRTQAADELKGQAAGDAAARLDEVAWSLQEELESGAGDEQAYLGAFSRARAAWAMAFAADSDANRAVLEAAYETQAALDSVDDFRTVLASLMS